MAKWTGSQFGVSKDGVKDLTGTDYKRSASSDDPRATKDVTTGMADSLSTQSGQTSMGDSRATKGGTSSGNTKTY